jgi:hypothetical protein
VVKQTHNRLLLASVAETAVMIVMAWWQICYLQSLIDKKAGGLKGRCHLFNDLLINARLILN